MSEATARLQALARILAAVGDDASSQAPADVVDMHERLDAEWRAWRQALIALDESSAAAR